MNRGLFANILYGFLLLIAFGASTYFWFTFFVKGRSLPTPNLIGRSLAEARAITSDLGLNLRVDETHRRNSDRVPVGHIVWQNRNAGTANFIKRGTTIRVELSAGPLVLRVPDLEGQSQGTAVLRVGQQQLSVGNLTYVDQTTSRGVMAVDPPKGTVVQADTQVSMLIAVPPSALTYVMPDLIDQPLDQIRPSLEARGLKVTTVKYEAYPGIVDGIIIRQYPLRGAPVSSRDPISVVVSKQEETAIVDQPPPVTQ